MRVEMLESVFPTPMFGCYGQTRELCESWEARVCMRVFSTLMSCSNTNKSCRRVDKSWWSWQARVCMWVLSTLESLGHTRTRVAWELMRVDKREFVSEFV